MKSFALVLATLALLSASVSEAGSFRMRRSRCSNCTPTSQIAEQASDGDYDYDSGEDLVATAPPAVFGKWAGYGGMVITGRFVANGNVAILDGTMFFVNPGRYYGRRSPVRVKLTAGIAGTGVVLEIWRYPNGPTTAYALLDRHQYFPTNNSNARFIRFRSADSAYDVLLRNDN